MHRLETIAPEVMSLLNEADEKRRLLVSLAACEWAVRQKNIEDPVVPQTLDELRKSSRLSKDLVSTLEKLRDKFDEQYYASHSVDLFGKARVISALIFATSGSANAAETIYEAAMSSDDRENLLKEIKSILSA